MLCYIRYRAIRATLAQLVEQPLRKRPVSGPSPEGGFSIPQSALLGFLFSRAKNKTGEPRSPPVSTLSRRFHQFLAKQLIH